jgi:hypothetical protein
MTSPASQNQDSHPQCAGLIFKLVPLYFASGIILDETSGNPIKRSGDRLRHAMLPSHLEIRLPGRVDDVTAAPGSQFVAIA